MVNVNRRETARSTGGTNARSIEELGVNPRIGTPLIRKFGLWENSFNRANRLTRMAIDALFRMDIQGANTLINAIDRAYVQAGFVFDIYTGLRNYVDHIHTSKAGDSAVG